MSTQKKDSEKKLISFEEHLEAKNKQSEKYKQLIPSLKIEVEYEELQNRLLELAVQNLRYKSQIAEITLGQREHQEAQESHKEKSKQK